MRQIQHNLYLRTEFALQKKEDRRDEVAKIFDYCIEVTFIFEPMPLRKLWTPSPTQAMVLQGRFWH